MGLTKEQREEILMLENEGSWDSLSKAQKIRMMEKDVNALSNLELKTKEEREEVFMLLKKAMQELNLAKKED